MMPDVLCVIKNKKKKKKSKTQFWEGEFKLSKYEKKKEQKNKIIRTV